MSAFLFLSLSVLVALLFGKYGTSRNRQRPYPPGPKPQPIIGNIFDLPTKDTANVYIEWGKKYNSESNDLLCPSTDIWAIGSVVHASAFGSHIVVLNKLEDAVELFERRATKYSDRPEYPIQKL
jgi:hypothetical protein